MPKENRLKPPETTFHIYMRGNNKKCVFLRNCEFRHFIKLMKRYKEKHEFLLYHYALMKNHIHLAIKSSKSTDISKMMQGLALSYNFYQRKRRNYVGHLWQGRFKSKVIEKDDYLLTVGLYIEANPVESGIVLDPSFYRWTSYKYYAFGEDDPLIDPNPLYESLGKTPTERQKAYKTLMQGKMERSTDNEKLLI